MSEYLEERAERKNLEKAKLSLIDLKCFEDLADVLEFGARKYSRNNWKKGLVMTEILDSMLRHISALNNGEYYDKESRLPHIGHIQANAMFLAGENNIQDIEFTDHDTRR